MHRSRGPGGVDIRYRLRRCRPTTRWGRCITVACLAALVACSDLDDSSNESPTDGGVDARGGSSGSGGFAGTKATGGSSGSGGGIAGKGGTSGAGGSAGDMGGGGLDMPDTGPPPPPPPTQHHVGGGCTSDMECIPGLTCDKTFPRGMCTKSCTTSRDCGSTGVCFASKCFHICPCTRNGYICIGGANPDAGEAGIDAGEDTDTEAGTEAGVDAGALADKPFCGVPSLLDGGALRDAASEQRDSGPADVSVDDVSVPPDATTPEDADNGG